MANPNGHISWKTSPTIRLLVLKCKNIHAMILKQLNKFQLSLRMLENALPRNLNISKFSGGACLSPRPPYKILLRWSFDRTPLLWILEPLQRENYKLHVNLQANLSQTGILNPPVPHSWYTQPPSATHLVHSRVEPVRTGRDWPLRRRRLAQKDSGEGRGRTGKVPPVDWPSYGPEVKSGGDEQRT